MTKRDFRGDDDLGDDAGSDPSVSGAVEQGDPSLSDLHISVVFGPDRGTELPCRGARLAMGTAADNHLILCDPTVSRRHCELVATPFGPLLRDLASRNGTRLGGLRVESAYVRPGSTILLGNTALLLEHRLHAVDGNAAVPPASTRTVATTPSMRRLLSVLARVARFDTTLLFKGEPGTGKTFLAQSVHQGSARRKGPFVPVRCAAIPATRIDRELFGQCGGAARGGDAPQQGSFEMAWGGTIFLDEVGTLPLDAQSKVMRVIEDGVVRRLGSNEAIDLDVRVIAATTRDLEEWTRRRRFRPDLLARLNTICVQIPPLRERTDDIPLLANGFYRALLGDTAATLPEDLQQQWARHPWPGNVQELRDAVQRFVTRGEVREEAAEEQRPRPAPDLSEGSGRSPLEEQGHSHPRASENFPDVSAHHPSFRQAKENAIACWEEEYLRELLSGAGGDVSRAARAARMNRKHLRQLMRRRNLSTGSTGI